MAAEPSAASDAAMSMQPPPAPAPASTIINDDSPRKTLICNATANITTLRKPIAKEMDQEFVTADFDAFLAAYLPFVPKDSDVDACFERMRNGGGTNNEPLIKPIQLTRPSPEDGKTTTEDKLSFHFAEQVEHPRKGPDGVTEKKVFANLDSIAEVIGESSIEGRDQQYKFFDCPDVSIGSDIAGSSNKIDASFVPVEFRKFNKKERLQTTNIAVACEWKLEKDKIPENNRQVVSANVQMTNCDVCRMFSFGISIDGNEMKLWHFSRSHSAVSEPVDYIQNPKLLIKAFMSFMFATPDEMGFDPTIARHSDGHFTYKLSESERYFRSTGCIFELRSNNITGRMTRVWSVKEVDSMSQNAQLISNHTYVLKDVWLDETSRTEREIQNDIFRDIERFWDPSHGAREDRDKYEELLAMREDIVTTGEYKKHFLTIEVDSTERLTKNAVSSTRVFGLFKNKQIKSVSGSKNAAGLDRNKVHLEQEDVHPLDSETQRKIIDRDFAPKKQYRVVFKEKCKTAGRLKTLGEVFDIVKQTLIPLQLMFCAGWVHRDISSGNILAYKPNEHSDWIAKLSDLEYAKKFPPSGDVKPHKDPKTGTPNFMAVEILSQRYMFSEESQHTTVPNRKMYAEMIVSGKVHDLVKKAPTPVVHNFQHDLECIWWFLLWSMTFRVNHEASQKYADSIFDNSLRLSAQRNNALTFSIFGNLTNAFIKPECTKLISFMDVIRDLLHTQYKKREQQDHLFNSSSYVDLHGQFQYFIDVLYGSRDIKDTTWRAIKLESTSLRKTSYFVTEASDQLAGPGKRQLSVHHDAQTTSTAGSSTKIEQPIFLGKGKRRASVHEDSEQMLDPREALEEDRPSKRWRLMDI